MGTRNEKAKRRSRWFRLRLEALEGRVVPSYFPSTTNGIHIIEDQLPSSLSNAMTKFVATHMDGTEKELLSQTNQFRAINPNFTVLHYQLGTGNSPYDYIINNQWTSDWSYVNGQESWFAHQSYSGEPQSAADLASGRVGNNTGWNQADIANSAWQQYTLNQVLQNIAATGSNAWFADSYTYGIGGAGYNNPIPTRYQGTNAANPADWPGGVTWTDQFANWAQIIEAAFAQYNAAHGANYKLLPNLDGRTTAWEPRWYDNASGIPFIDGAFLESFGQATDTFDWTFSMNQGLNLTGNGKIVIMQPYPSSAPNTAAGQQQIDFFLGTYLLIKGDQTYLNIDYGGGVQYYPEYRLNLGTATTPLPSDVSGYLWNNVYRRDFQNGFVLVNPGSTTYTLNLGGNYQKVVASGGGTMTDSQIDANGNYIGGSLSYQNVSSVTLAGGSAAIFLNPAASTLVVSGFPSPSTAGMPGSFTVTAEDSNGHVASGYTGTVHFASSDSNAVLPADYTFTASDAGVHSFTATLKTAGSQSITAKDTVTASITGTQSGITVSASATSALHVTAPQNAKRGQAFTITVTAVDAFSNTVTTYSRTVHFASSDSQAILPANYTFTGADAGVHVFTNGVTLKTSGNQTVTATDTANGSITGQATIKVGGLEPALFGRVSVTGQWWAAVSNGSSAFTNSLWASWSPNVTWVDVLTGDFNGDGQTDIIARDLATGNWWVGLSNGSSFSTAWWGQWSPNVTWVDVRVGDFTGSGVQDIVGRVKETGQWWMSVPNGSGGFTTSLWDTWSTGVTWVDVKVGDFNGDGKMDIVGRAQEIGQWWVAQSTGSSFINSLWATWSAAATWVDVQVGDFTGDGKADITGRWLQGGSWWTGVSNGSAFTTAQWGQWSAAVAWVDVNVGDFNGDGKDDLVGRWSQAGQWWVAISSGSSFTNSLWATWSTGATWVDVKVGDFNDDGKADITGRWLEGGSWWTAISNGSQFTTSQWGSWSSSVNWVDVRLGKNV